MTEWPVVPLAQVATLINGDRGRNYPGSEDRVSAGVPFVNAGHLAEGRVRMHGMDFITPERHRILRSGHIEVGDVLLCIRGSHGQAAIATPDVVPGAIASSLVLIRPTARILSRFLLAYLRGPIGAQLIASGDNGAAQPNIGAGEVARFGVPLPPLTIQRKISGILQAMDDLIDINRRRIELLEQMAQAIYREWFVHLRYPGHENVAVIDSPLGLIPEGWTVSTCGQVLRVLGGGTPSKAERSYWEGGTIPWYTPSDLTRRPSRFTGNPAAKITEVGLRRSSARLFPAGSVLMTSRATLGVLAISATTSSCNQGFIVISSDNRWPSSFIYEWLKDHAAQLEPGSTALLV